MDRNHRAKVIYLAERLERNTKSRGRQAGQLGQSGLVVLRALLFRFGGGRCSPSYAALRTATGLCLDTIAHALGRLERAALITKERRTVRTRLGARRITNLYGFLGQQSLPLVSGEPREPIARRFLPTRFVPLESLSPSLQVALEQLGAAIQTRNQS